MRPETKKDGNFPSHAHLLCREGYQTRGHPRYCSHRPQKPQHNFISILIFTLIFTFISFIFVTTLVFTSSPSSYLALSSLYPHPLLHTWCRLFHLHLFLHIRHHLLLRYISLAIFGILFLIFFSILGTIFIFTPYPSPYSALSSSSSSFSHASNFRSNSSSFSSLFPSLHSSLSPYTASSSSSYPHLLLHIKHLLFHHISFSI